MLTALSATDEACGLIRKWLSSYVAQPHPKLGRRGPICPYVSQALASDSILFAAYRFCSEEPNLDRMNLAIAQGIARFQQVAREQTNSDFLSLILTFPDLDRKHWELIDAGHHASKTSAVRKGLMLGQFHPCCDAAAAHNTDFPVNRAPLPLIVIRHMSSHDILFLDQNEIWLDYYRSTLNNRGVSADHLIQRARERSGDGDEIDPRTDEDCPVVRRTEAETASAPYVRYARVDQLHEMQFPHSDSPLELSFILITQIKELLFRMLYVELDTARTRIQSDEITEACQALTRAHRVQRVLSTSWDTLTGMSTTDFVGFRGVLGNASGRQSFIYRALEFIMGNKDSNSLDCLAQYGPLHRILAHEVDTPSLYDEVVNYLHRNVRSMSDAVRQLDASCGYVANQDVEAAWLVIYREPSKYAVAYALAEALIELSFQFSQWRATHLLVVERMIGAKDGTGGTDGVQWLRRINEHRFFPELWSVRTEI